MYPSCDCRCSAELALARWDPSDLQVLQARVSAEYREMPGLKLTLAQAARLFSIEAARCKRVLGSLVEGGVLATDGRTFARADSGPRRG